jgi:hypothetical protein
MMIIVRFLIVEIDGLVRIKEKEGKKDRGEKKIIVKDRETERMCVMGEKVTRKGKKDETKKGGCMVFCKMDKRMK